MLTAKDFLAEIERFLKSAEMSASAFGRAAVGDPSFVSDLRGGRMPNLRIVGKVNDYIQRELRQRARRGQGRAA